jgi:hypothetical protein
VPPPALPPPSPSLSPPPQSQLHPPLRPTRRLQGRHEQIPQRAAPSAAEEQLLDVVVLLLLLLPRDRHGPRPTAMATEEAV